MPCSNPRCPERLAILLMLVCFAAPAIAEQNWSVRLLGVKVGQMQLNWTQNANTYDATARFQTTGMAGALAKVRFNLHSKGTTAPTLVPLMYQEDMHTGQRQSAARVTFQNGKPAQVTGRLEQTKPSAPMVFSSPLDPMAALYESLHARPKEQLCKVDRQVFDGARLTHIRLIKRQTSGGDIICTGRYDRVAGYPAKAMAQADHFPIEITFQRQGPLWHPSRVKLKSLYGPVTLIRRD